MVGLAHDAVDQSYVLKDGRDAYWIRDPSIQNAILFNVFLEGDKKRKNNPDELACVHAIRTGHKAANDDDLCEIFIPHYSAFILINHDTPECDNDLIEKMQNGKLAIPKGFECPKPDRAISFIANQIWVGSPALHSQIGRHLEEITDTFGLHKDERIDEQTRRNGNLKKTSFLTRRGRVIEKNDSACEDAERIFYLSPEQLFTAAELAVTKYKILLAIKKLGELPQQYEKEYTDAMSSLLIASTKRNSPKKMRPVINMFSGYGFREPGLAA